MDRNISASFCDCLDDELVIQTYTEKQPGYTSSNSDSCFVSESYKLLIKWSFDFHVKYVEIKPHFSGPNNLQDQIQKRI